MSPVAPSFTFYCCHVVICPFPSLTNEAEQPGQVLCGPGGGPLLWPINNAKKGRCVYLFGGQKKTPPFLCPAPITDFLRSSVLVNDQTRLRHESWLISGHTDVLYSHCRESMCTDASSWHEGIFEWPLVNVWTFRHWSLLVMSISLF